MKRLIKFTAALWLLLPIISFSQVTFVQNPYPAPVVAESGGGLTDSLIAYYAFEETSGNLIDLHNSFDGTNSGTFVQDTTGLIDSAYYYGASSYTTISGINLNGDVFSISLWMYIGASDFSRFMMGKGVSQPNLYLPMLSSGEWIFKVQTDNSNVVDTLTTTPPSGQWNHIVMTYDGSNVRIYMNNTLEETQAVTGDVSNPTENIYIGGFGSQTFRDFNGRIDEVGIWRGKALSVSEVSTLYNSGSGVTYSGL